MVASHYLPNITVSVGTLNATSSQTRPLAAAGRRHRPGDAVLAGRLRRETQAEVLFDPFSRGRYSTDASHYQIEPIGVMVPRTWDDVVTAIQIAADSGVPILARGGGTSQCGQTIGEALVIDVSKYLNRLVSFDAEGQSAIVEPGIVLDQLNARLAAHGLMFPVDVSTASRATLGGMTGNNSCGTRSIRYGTMRNNVQAIDVILADGERASFGPLRDSRVTESLMQSLLALGRREADEIDRRFPKLMRRVGGYNIDALVNKAGAINLAQLLVGSEGTLAFSQRVHIKLRPVPTHSLLGVCHFPRFYDAMDAAQHLVELGPSAVELIDRTMIDLSREIPMYRTIVDQFVRGTPEALLLVEFAGEEHQEQLRKLNQLVARVAELGFPESVVKAVDPKFQKAIWEVRKSGLNIMMSMKGDRKPISFIEDCAVRLEDLAEYTDRLTQVFQKYGTTGTWYAHASVGCLHVRPVLNLKLEADTTKMRAIAEEAFEMVREYKGSHSGEHGDGLVRSEFHESMFGARMLQNFHEVKRLLDPQGLMNPGKIVDAPKMDDRTLFRFKPGYQVETLDTGLDWSAWHSFAGAVEMCNNNGACRKVDASVMCPSYRVTGDEQHLTRGRANSLRLALSGQLGAGAFTSPEMYDTLKLCVSCKGCKRECPTGVDMAKMKIEFLHHYHRERGLSWHDRAVAYLPRYAPLLGRVPGLLNLRNRVTWLRTASERFLEFSASRPLPAWKTPFAPGEGAIGAVETGECVLFGDTFNRYFEPHNLVAAVAVLRHCGYRIHLPRATDSKRPLCCGRTFLTAGLIDEARREAKRTLSALLPYLRQGVPIVGLEPSCVLTFRDEYLDLLDDETVTRLAQGVSLFEEFMVNQDQAGKLGIRFEPLPGQKILVHGHCHQKAFGLMDAVTETLAMIPGVDVETIQSSCCGMAGAFGYHSDTHEISLEMAELDLLPSVRSADADTLVVADGTSCRHQIFDGTNREAVHVVGVLKSALPIP